VTLRDSLSAMAAQEAEAAQSADLATRSLHALEEEAKTLAEQVALPAEGLLASLRGDLRALEAAGERDAREQEQLEHRRRVVAEHLGGKASEAHELIAEIQEADAAVGPAHDAYLRTVEETAKARTAHEEAEARFHAASVAVASTKARAEAIAAALDGLGTAEAVELVERSDAAFGTIATLLDAPADVAVAVDAALGETGRGVLARSDDGVAAMVRELKQASLGGIAVVAPDEPPSEVPARAVAASTGVEALVDRLGPAADAGLAARILGDVVICEGWQAARSIVAAHPAIRAVTPEGDVVTAHAVRVAVPDGAGPATLEAALAAVEAAETEASRSASLQTTARRALAASVDAEQKAREHLELLEARVAGHTEALALNERSRNEAEAEVRRLDARAEALAQAAAARDERITELRLRVGEMAGEERQRQEAWEAIHKRRDEVFSRRDAAREAHSAATATAAALAERRSSTERRMTRIEAELSNLEERPVDEVDLDRLEATERIARDAVSIVGDHVSALRERQRELRERAGVADGELVAAESRRDELETAVRDSRERMARLSIELAEVNVRLEATAEGLRRDADATEEQAFAAPRPDLGEGIDPTEALAGAEARLRRMGPINPLAAEEYAEVAAEVETLETQLADLDESKRELRKVIAALDEEMATLFMRAFEEISSFYEENFGLVFPGGRGRLRLSDPSNPLQTGVEIEAQPAGKRVGRLSLLSGGERSMAALAFLFAVFRARPSPFYVLDEVEAALDDANLRRFLRLVDTLRNSAQLVIITHQQQTMEAADLLYGVTMEPAESSIVVAKRFDRTTH
jgi:chromosome segregation protein